MLPGPAMSYDDCLVGPSAEERAQGGPHWGGIDEEHQRGTNKRQCLGHRGGTDTTATSAPKNNSSTFIEALKTFLSSGCCLIPDVLPHDYVLKSKLKFTSDVQYYLSLKNRASSETTTTIDLSKQENLIPGRINLIEIADAVDGKTRDIPFHHLDRFPFTAPGLVYNPIVYPLVRELLGGRDVSLLNAGVMWSMPQSERYKKPEQATGLSDSLPQWCSGDHLFDHVQLPPHCIKVFYPLTDLEESETGPMQIIPGTHRLELRNNGTDTAATAIKICYKAGSAFLFDSRLCYYRGGDNFTSEPTSPILYLTYARSFFTDSANPRPDDNVVISPPSPPPWTAQLLTGDPVPMGEEGFQCSNAGDEEWKTSGATTTGNTRESSGYSLTSGSTTPSSQLSRERESTFTMDVDVPGSENPKVLTMHEGDDPEEVSRQFCREHGLGDHFAPTLADMIAACAKIANDSNN